MRGPAQEKNRKNARRTPAAFPCPNSVTLWQWLTEAHQRGLIRREGSGRRSEPFRYYLPEKLEKWKTDPMYQIEQICRQSKKQLAEMGIDVPVG